MLDYEFRRTAAAIEKFGGGFFKSLIPAFKSHADPINRQILLDAFKTMHGSEKYLPGGIHYEDNNSTPEIGMTDLDRVQIEVLQRMGISE